MSVRTIKRAGKIVGYQAIAGAGGAGKSAYFGVATHGDAQAKEKAAWYAEHMAAWVRPARRPAMLGNAGGIPGLQLVYQPSRREGDPPVLYAKATWVASGRNVKRMYSTQVHGKEGAVAKAVAARERGASVKIGRPIAEVVAILEERL